MLFNVAADIAKLSLFIVCAYVLLGAYARRRRPQWTEHLTERRVAVLGILTLAVGGIKLIEDVVAKESGPVDKAMLWFVRDHVPAAMNGFFAVVTLSGSATFLAPVAVAAAVALLVARRRFEAVLVGASLTTATLVVWVMKAIVGRARPELWDSQWTWGSSFPSGHTLSTAALSTAAALCVARIWPRTAIPAMALAVLWTGLVAVSRLVLGVHWPSDVLAAMCLGAFIALLFSVAYDLHRQSPVSGDRSV
ncbi:MAG: phosphatase PAP2 family protein [Rubrivivax sp.]|nr:phosphatase PAP2 family protein [Rubrivivax sp.]MDP3082927.1 phosphatase PAP2 family protein [Rubrivivax sp.]